MTRLIGGLVVFIVLSLGCGGGSGATAEERDVSGNYAVTYDNKLTVKLDVGGAVRERTLDGYGGVVDFGVINGQPATIDLGSFCARPDVQCPSETLWTKVAIHQPDLRTSKWELQKLEVIDDRVHVLDAGVKAAAVGGLVDHAQTDRFLLGLGATGGANQACFVLGLSLASGRFTRVGERLETVTEHRFQNGQRCDAGLGADGGADAGALDAAVPDAGAGDAGAATDGGAADAGVVLVCSPVNVKRIVAPPGAAVDGITDGKVFVGYTGGCAFGPFLAGATVTFETGYEAKRTGKFDPPPFTPAPIVLPDGGVDGGLDLSDAGRVP